MVLAPRPIDPIITHKDVVPEVFAPKEEDKSKTNYPDLTVIMNPKSEDRPTFFAQPGILAGEYFASINLNLNFNFLLIIVSVFCSSCDWWSSRRLAVCHTGSDVHRIPNAQERRRILPAR